MMIYENLRKTANRIVELPLLRKPLEDLDRRINSFNGSPTDMPIFLVGPPRSGTTLLYQLLNSIYDFAFVNSLMNLFYYAPLLMAKISHCARWFLDNNMNTENRYGVINGILSPDEGEKIWGHLFPEIRGTHYLQLGSYTNQQLANARRIVHGISTIAKRPYLNKHPSNSLRLAALAKAFPVALCIVIVRHPVYNAQSLCIARQQKIVDEHGWWASKPKEYNSICQCDSVLQSVYQVYYILRQLDADRALFDNRMMWVAYEDLCRQPKAVLSSLVEFMKKHGLEPSVKDNVSIPKIYHRNERKTGEGLFHRIETEVDRIFAGWHPKITEESIY